MRWLGRQVCQGTRKDARIPVPTTVTMLGFVSENSGCRGNQLTVRWGGYPGLSRWAQCNHKGPGEKEDEESEMEKEMGGQR